MISLWFGLLACGAEPQETNKEVSKTEAFEEPTVDMNAIEQRAIDVTKEAYEVLAPSPEETRLAVERAGIVTGLASLVPEREFTLDGLDQDHTALRVGIVLSDTILLIKELPKAKLVANLGFIGKGLRQMNAGEGLCQTIDEYATEVGNDAMTRDDLLFGLEQIASMSVPEEGVGVKDDSGPMLQAGAWTAGISLVSEAILKENRIDTADKLLRHGPTADYFLTYVRKGAENKAATPVLQQLEASLLVLKGIATKETIQIEDIEKVKSETKKLLGMI